MLEYNRKALIHKKYLKLWETGVCLPDVSVYLQLCEILGISVNEFLAGEDIEQQDVVQKADETLLEVSKNHRQNMKRMKYIVMMVVIAAVTIISILGSMIVRERIKPVNYIETMSPDSTEVKAVKMVSGVDGAYLFHYNLQDEFNNVGIVLKEYRYGELVNQEILTGLDNEDQMVQATDETIAVIPDAEKSVIRFVIEYGFGKGQKDIEILQDADHPEQYFRGYFYPAQREDLKYGEETMFFGLLCNRNQINAFSYEDIQSSPERLKNYEYAYIFSIYPGGDLDTAKNS